jgi:Stage II sporulation protein E (SpoIIE)
MRPLGWRHLWLKLTLAVGSLLGLLLLAQSVVTYYQVSRILVTQELWREAQQHARSIGREARRLNIRDPAELSQVIEDIRQDPPDKIAWIRVVDMAGHTLVQNGNPVGPSLGAERLRRAMNGLNPVSEVRETKAGGVLVTVFALRLATRQPLETGQPQLDRQPEPDRRLELNRQPQPDRRRELNRQPQPDRQSELNRGSQLNRQSQLDRQSQPDRPQLDRRPELNRQPAPPPPPVLRFVEMALYLKSASAAFGRLRRDLIVSSSAALLLLASMILLWLRFPHYVRGKQLERQTELARQVQMDMLPASDAAFENLDFAAACVPAWQVGGDFYDVFAAGHGRMAVVLGDVSGKGLPAAVVAALLLGVVRASSWTAGGSEHVAASRRLSEFLHSRTSLERFASLFWCYYEPESQVLRYVNAGHPPPLLVKRDAGGELKIQRLTEGGPVLGLLQGADYRQGQAVVCPGDLLVLYSDGVVEAENAPGQQFERGPPRCGRPGEREQIASRNAG